MRKIIFFLIVFIYMITSCTINEFKPNDWGIEPSLEFSPLVSILTPSSPTDTIQIKTNYLEFKISNIPSWLNVKKIESVHAIEISANEMLGSAQYREAYITVSVSRGIYDLSRDFVVIQFKKDVINNE